MDNGSSVVTPPGLTDDVNITFDEDFNDGGAAALVLSSGDVAQGVTVRGISHTVHRRMHVTGDSAFASLDYEKGSRNGLAIDTGVSLSLSGGSAGTPTFKTDVRHQFFGTSYSFDGDLEASSSQVFFELDGVHGGRLVISNPAASVDFDSRTLFIGAGGTIEFAAAPTVFNAPDEISFVTSSGQLISQSGTLGDFSNTHLRVDQERTSRGVVSGGTFQSVRVGTTTSSSGSPGLDIAGDLSVDGDIGDGETAVRVLRKNRTSGVPSNNFARMQLFGYDLTVPGTGDVVVGEVDATAYSSGTSPHRSQRSELNMTSSGGRDSTVSLGGDLIVGVNGILVGSSGTQIELAGDFVHSSQSETGHDANTQFDVSQASFTLNGPGTITSPQQFEVQGFDFGSNNDDPNAHTQGMAQYGIGSLIIGPSSLSPTWVELTDAFDFEFDSENDALYLSALTVNEGSGLLLNGQKVYVQGVQVVAFDDQYGPGLILDNASQLPVPEPTTAVLIGFGALALLKRRRNCGRRNRATNQ